MQAVLIHTASAQTAPAASHALPSLFASSQQLPLSQAMGVWVTPKSDAIAAKDLLPASARSAFAPWKPGMRLPTSTTQDVWLQLLLPASPEPQTWILRIPRTSLDKATLYAQQTEGQVPKRLSSAGLSLPRSQWALPARDPSFALTTLPAQTQLFFIHLEHRQTITEDIQLIAHSDFSDAANRLGMIYGLILGVFSILMMGSLISAWILRSQHFCWLALFSLSLMLSQLTLSGYMSVRVWPDSVFLNHMAGWIFPLLSLAALARLALSVSYAKSLSKPVFYSLWAVIAVCAVLVAVLMVLPLEASRIFLNPVYAWGLAVILGSLCWIAWRSQDWLWWLIASIVPVMLSAVMRLAYNFGWVAHVEIALLAGVITSGLGVVACFTVLYLHQRDRLSSQQRLQSMDNTDASTGLFNERIARARLPQIILRSKRFERSCGAILIRWLDFERVMATSVSTQRGQIFSHLGSRLSRLARDIDTVARIGDDLFLFLIEAPVTREDVNMIASQILSTCLRPSAVMPETKGFDLHLAVWLSGEVEADAQQALELLKTRIDQMRHGTQRRVQFVGSELSTGPSVPLNEQEQAKIASELVAKINSLEATQGLPRIYLKPRDLKPNQP
jgi:two-component system, sensor histidine kinase LadS